MVASFDPVWVAGIVVRDDHPHAPISLGHGGVLWSELRGVASPESLVQNYMIGLGGGDIRPEHIEEVVADLIARECAAEPQIQEIG